MTEAELQSNVIDMAHAFGWLVAHFRSVRVQRKDGSVFYETPVQADGAGWPDLFMVHTKTGRALVRECKSKTGKASPEQLTWLASLSRVDPGACVWRPKQWMDGTIEKELRDVA